MNRLKSLAVLFAVTLSLVALPGCKQTDVLVIEKTADAQHARIGVMTGSTSEAIATQQFPQAHIQSFDNVADAFGALKSGQLDAIITAYSTSLLLVRRNPDLRLLDEKLSIEDTAIAVHKGNTELFTAVDKIISDLKAEGAFQSMSRRWFKTGPGPYEQIDIPLPATGEPLRVGVSATREPFSFVDENGRVSGHDGDLARLIAQRLKRPVEFHDMKFLALIPALQSGKIDMIVTGMTATDQRRKFVDFTQPYYANSQVMMVRNWAAGVGPATAEPGFWDGLKESIESNILAEKRYLLLWEGLKVTFIISVLSTLFGTALGGIVCFMRMARSPLLQVPARIFISVLRGIPVVVLLMLIFYVVFASVNISPVLVAVVAFGLNFAAYAAEIFRTGIEGIETGQTEAGLAMGFSRKKTFRLVILPQMVRRILPVYKGEVISIVKMTSIVGYIAVLDLTKASDIIRARTFDAFFPLVLVAVLYFLMSYMLIALMDWAERRTDPRRKTRKVSAA
ncbi:ABC transporter permease subunit [Aestuariivirga sp.]|uniref:ABC transporter permease subunit n=1 Tax=Aestuariivirga sp. TaxID=2650926 RepID=UPI003BABC47F